jgi:hypothetical protein
MRYQPLLQTCDCLGQNNHIKCIFSTFPTRMGFWGGLKGAFLLLLLALHLSNSFYFLPEFWKCESLLLTSNSLWKCQSMFCWSMISNSFWKCQLVSVGQWCVKAKQWKKGWDGGCLWQLQCVCDSSSSSELASFVHHCIMAMQRTCLILHQVCWWYMLHTKSLEVFPDKLKIVIFLFILEVFFDVMLNDLYSLISLWH